MPISLFRFKEGGRRRGYSGSALQSLDKPQHQSWKQLLKAKRTTGSKPVLLPSY
jgi:hypothetical protein